MNDKIGRWTILFFDKNKCYCKCDCGNEKYVDKYSLKSMKSTSCGCLRSEKLKLEKTKHGLVSNPLYNVWCDIKKRCYNKNNKRYKDYGGRGIYMDSNWMNNFESFYNWSINNGYEKGLQIDRIDNNSGYTPNNCRYVSQLKNANNKRNNCFIYYNGINQTAADWGRITGIRKESIARRVRNGMIGADAIYGKIKNN